MAAREDSGDQTVRSTAVRRVLAFSVDWLLICAWAGVLVAAVMLLTNGSPHQPAGPWTAQLIGLISMTLPVTLAFALFECSVRRATPGKQLLGLVVTTEAGARLSFPTSLLRNALKFLPWEMGHTVAQQAIFAGEAGIPFWVFGPAAIAFVGPFWWIVAIFLTGRSPFDRWSHARVALLQAGPSR